MTVSASECAASDIIAEEWLIRPPISLATAMARFASPATMTVPVDSPPESSAWPRRPHRLAALLGACVAGAVGAGCVDAAAMPADWRRHGLRCPAAMAVRMRA